MQRRYKDDLIVVLQLIFSLSFQLPIRIIDQDQDTWAPEKVIASDSEVEENKDLTYTEPFSMNSSALSFNR
jgi:hypothetical protein